WLEKRRGGRALLQGAVGACAGYLLAGLGAYCVGLHGAMAMVWTGMTGSIAGAGVGAIRGWIIPPARPRRYSGHKSLWQFIAIASAVAAIFIAVAIVRH